MDSLELKPCDIFFTHGESLISKVIRFGERNFGQGKALVNHAGIIVESGGIQISNAVEALRKVEKHTLYSEYHNQKDKISIYRPTFLTEKEKTSIVQKANSYVGKDYGWFKILAHSLDYFLGKKYIFRRLTDDDNYPICSWVVAYSYFNSYISFGCDPGMASPDDIWKYCESNPDKYNCILRMEKI